MYITVYVQNIYMSSPDYIIVRHQNIFMSSPDYIIVRHQTHGVYGIQKPEGPGLWRLSEARALLRA